MPLKSTQTNKYETKCFVQESPTSSEMTPNGYKIHHSKDTGATFVVFEATIWTFGSENRNRRIYDQRNAEEIIRNDERIRTLKAQNKWRGEFNHPNPDIKGQRFSDIRMTIPEPMRTSHFINNDRFEGSRYRATITTHPSTECGKAATSEIVDLGIVPSFSVRVLGEMIPNARPGQPNMRVNKLITADMVDFPSHQEANADIQARDITQEAAVVFLKDLAEYCVESDEKLSVVCESFEITKDEILGIHNGSIVVADNKSRIFIPLERDMRREAAAVLLGRGFK